MNEIIKGMANAAEAIQENFEEQGEKITAVEQNISLLNPIPISKTFTLTFADGYATVSASDLGVADVAAHYWIVQGYYTGGSLIIVPRLYSGSMALYAFFLPGLGLPSEDLLVTITRVS